MAEWKRLAFSWVKRMTSIRNFDISMGNVGKESSIIYCFQ